MSIEIQIGVGKATGVKKVTNNSRAICWEKIPQSLVRIPQWVAWKSRKCSGSGRDKPAKVPIDPKTGKNAAVNDPKTWASFAKAKEYWEDWEVDGIGFVLTEDDPFVVIDLDNCWNQQTKLTKSAQQIVKPLQSYSEVSPSGTGVHTWVQGSVARSVRKSGVEIYRAGRFITVTGWHLNVSSPPTITRCDRELGELFLKTASCNDANGNERDNSAAPVTGSMSANACSPQLRITPRPPLAGQIPAEQASSMGRASQSHPWEDELSLKSRLRSMEHEKEHHHAEAAKSIDEGLEQGDRRNQVPQNIERGEDEIPH